MTDTDMLYMAALVKENERLKELLRECQPVLRRAFFANYKDTNTANELYDKIKKVVGGASDEKIQS
jgi:hypothetical protein